MHAGASTTWSSPAPTWRHRAPRPTCIARPRLPAPRPPRNRPATRITRWAGSCSRSSSPRRCPLLPSSGLGRSRVHAFVFFRLFLCGLRVRELEIRGHLLEVGEGVLGDAPLEQRDQRAKSLDRELRLFEISLLGVELRVAQLGNDRDRRQQQVGDLHLPDVLEQLLRRGLAALLLLNHARSPSAGPAPHRSPPARRPRRSGRSAAPPRSPRERRGTPRRPAPRPSAAPTRSAPRARRARAAPGACGGRSARRRAPSGSPARSSPRSCGSRAGARALSRRSPAPAERSANRRAQPARSL